MRFFGNDCIKTNITSDVIKKFLQENIKERFHEDIQANEVIALLFHKIQALPPYCKPLHYSEGDIVGFHDESLSSDIYRLAKQLRPWKKGPFLVGNFTIDSEWVSSIKYNILEPHIDIRNKIVADVGCNNGYYMFRMLKHAPKKIIGFDPSARACSQFLLINHFLKTSIEFMLCGVERLELFKPFDVIFCLGVLYHRTDPLSTLKILKRSLNKGGVLFLDSIIIDDDSYTALCPKERYAKMKNVYFIPTPKTLESWLLRAGFRDIQFIDKKPTTSQEQRQTEWSNQQSLNDFLCPNNQKVTIEGYPAPIRLYVKACI